MNVEEEGRGEREGSRAGQQVWAFGFGSGKILMTNWAAGGSGSGLSRIKNFFENVVNKRNWVLPLWSSEKCQ
jgi:hypothetical protein